MELIALHEVIVLAVPLRSKAGKATVVALNFNPYTNSLVRNIRLPIL